MLAAAALLRIAASLNPRSSCHTCLISICDEACRDFIFNAVSYVEPSSATIISAGGTLCRRYPSMTRSRYKGRLYVLTIMEARGKLFGSATIYFTGDNVLRLPESSR